MIKVTLGEQPKEEKEFPKLMIGNYGTIIEAITAPNAEGKSVVIVRLPEFSYHIKFQLVDGGETFSDYPNTITLQNA